MIARNKKKLLISIVMILLIAGPFLSFRSSEVNTNFPVPNDAELTRRDVKEGFEEYSWSPASEENGLPFYYAIVIRLWGWKQESRFGATTYYEKQGVKMSTTSLNNSLFISMEKE